MSKGVLEDKILTYYSGTDLDPYKAIFSEGVRSFKGRNFTKILDIGSGSGFLPDAIKPYNFDIEILEASKIGLNVLREKGYNPKEFFLDYGKPLPFDDSTFSMVIMNQVIEHIDKKTGIYYINEVMRVLDDGGVFIIKSPSKYCRVWNTDPHHIYCWKPNELKQYVSNNFPKASLKMERGVIEPWMLFKYDEELINTWHKENKHPVIKNFLRVPFFLIDRLIFKKFNLDYLLSVSNLTITKNV